MQNSENVVSAFTDEQTARLTGLSVAQLRSWDRSGFFVPSMAADDRRVQFSRIYSFVDLLSLQVLRTLRKDMGCSLQHLRGVKTQLEALHDTSWSNTVLHVLNKKVVFHDKVKDEFYEPESGQKVFNIPLHVVRSDMRSAIKTLWVRDSSAIGKVSQKRRVVHNEIVIDGTRIPVRSIRDFLDAGYSTDRIIQEYPVLKVEDVEAARRYVKAA